MPIVEHNNRLKVLAAERNITITEIAHILDISIAQVSYYATGSKNVPFEHIPKLSRILGVTKEQLLEELNVVK
jgi:transcriptional regulator with XRE-family HTH domain